MKKLLKILVVTFGLVVSSVVVIGLLDFGMDKYEEVTWTPPTEIDGIYLGMTRSDLLFNFNYHCYEPPDDEFGLLFLTAEGDVRTCDSMGSKNSYPDVRLKGDRVVSLLDSHGVLTNLLVSIYQFEREILLERQRVGIAKAKRDGKFKGSVPTAKNKSAEIIELTNQGMKPSEIAKKLDIGVASVYRHRLKV